ncbi:glycerophosphodiester phosphodiesterase family protein [Pseudopelagicola sp. nBUS_19]|uniref:glycerophosphodiester phosphodiesterase family protein n=1 Tax=Pseudopelagicola sp. nBUS_19 TaxID=3395316 RepID=UPI003EBC7BDE
MTPPLHKSFLTVPLAHRALHDITDGRPENSRAAIRAALALGYGIEIDLQLSQDGEAMVFHDYDLGRLTGETGPVRQRTATELSDIMLSGGEEGVPTLSEVLTMVDGQVPVLVELKDQDGALGPDVGILETAAAQAADGYEGPLAYMSFNPESVAAMARVAPNVPRGLVTESFPAGEWSLIKAVVRNRLREIPDYDRVGASFISHQASDLNRSRVLELKSTGAHILCWTVRSPKVEAEARKIADNVTFEGYLA